MHVFWWLGIIRSDYLKLSSIQTLKSYQNIVLTANINCNCMQQRKDSVQIVLDEARTCWLSCQPSSFSSTHFHWTAIICNSASLHWVSGLFSVCWDIRLRSQSVNSKAKFIKIASAIDCSKGFGLRSKKTKISIRLETRKRLTWRFYLFILYTEMHRN